LVQSIVREEKNAQNAERRSVWHQSAAFSAAMMAIMEFPFHLSVDGGGRETEKSTGTQRSG